MTTRLPTDPRPSYHEAWQTGSEGDSGALFAVVTPFIRYWRSFATCLIGTIVLAVGVTLLLPKKYTAGTTFTPETASLDKLPGGLAGLAGQFGISLAAGGGSSPDFFGKLLTSRAILDSTLRTRFRPSIGQFAGRPTPLIDILEIEGTSERERLDKGIRKLQKWVLAAADKKTGMVSLTVELRDPELAAQVANGMIGILADFNLRRMQRQSHEQRRFTEERLRQVEGELRAAESTLISFLTGNRAYQGSPVLQFQKERLERQVQIKQDLVAALRRDFEQARIAEVRDTPVLTVVDSATTPTKKSAPIWSLNLVVAAVLGGIAGMGAVFLRALSDRARNERWVGYDEFTRSLAAFRSELRLGRGRA